LENTLTPSVLEPIPGERLGHAAVPVELCIDVEIDPAIPLVDSDAEV
jgi:hypothetical protein